MKHVIRLFFIALVFSGCSKSIPLDQKVLGDWDFDYIKDQEGNNVKPIAKGDNMVVNEDGSFDYQLSQIKLRATGTWEVNTDDSTIIYTYSAPTENQRTYKLSFPEENKMIFFEKGINYAFKK